MRTRLVLLLAALLVAAGCSGGDDPDPDDVAFVQGMVPHHEQAVEMAAMVDDHADVSPELADLADRIEAAQQPEIDRMEGWLDDWDVDDHGSMDHGDMEGMDHGGMDHGGMDGMMSADQMSELASLDGAAFEQRWLEMMIEHHRGAVRSAESVITDGTDPDVRDLARDVVRTQTAEITEMEGLLR